MNCGTVHFSQPTPSHGTLLQAHCLLEDSLSQERAGARLLTVLLKLHDSWLWRGEELGKRRPAQHRCFEAQLLAAPRSQSLSGSACGLGALLL